MLLFVAAGSLLLLAWLYHQQREESQRVFITVVQNDADFVRRLNLPRSPKLATDLQQLLRMDIHFRNREGLTEPALRPAEAPGLTANASAEDVLTLPGGRQALILRLDDRHDMIFIRESPTMTLSLWHPATRNALIAFWLLAAVFAWILGQQVVRPVGRLTRRLTGFFQAESRSLPETARRDEIGELARSLTQAREDLIHERERREQSERLALLGRVATGLAHEIKNPLASIQLHAQLMETVDLDAESQVSLQHLLAEVRVIEGLVNQWLYLARPASPRKQPLDLRALLAETVQMLHPQAEHAGVQIRVMSEPGLPDSTSTSTAPLTLSGDRMRLQQVFRNILLNGIQAMPGGGDLTVSLEPSPTGDLLTLRFHDQGAGFSSAALEHGAELFFSEKEGGMGVGLNVAQEIISAHSGQIWLKNDPKGGAIVQISLPMGKS